MLALNTELNAVADIDPGDGDYMIIVPTSRVLKTPFRAVSLLRTPW